MKPNRMFVIVLVALVIIAAVIIVNVISFSGIKSLLIDQIKEKQLIETRHAANQIEEHITQVKDELVTLTKFPILKSLDISKCSGNMTIVHQNIEGKIKALLRVDKEGNVVECSTPEFSNYVGLNIRNKDYFISPKESNEPYITGVREGTSRQIIISAPLFETTEYTPYPNFVGEFKGVLLTIIDMNSLYFLYIHSIVEADPSVFLLYNTKTNETILKSDEVPDFHELQLPSTDIVAILDAKGLGESIVTSSDIIFGIEKWRILVFTPLKKISSQTSALQQKQLIGLGFAIIIITIALVFLILLYKSKEDITRQLSKATVTLEKLGINAGVETERYSQADVSLSPNKLYLITEDGENHAHEIFISTLNSGYAGLGIVREDPRVMRQKYNLQKTSFIWLTSSKVEGIPCESDIANLFELIAQFIKQSKKSVILIDRLDYIFRENIFEEVVRKIHALNDLCHVHQCIIIISAHEDALEERQLKAIEAEAIDLYGKHLKAKVALPEQEMNILKYINDQNVMNKLVSFKDITQQFNITKPTTRVKIDKLKQLGLVDIDQRGRFKALKITSSGRRILG